jgi:hypothetical protein
MLRSICGPCGLWGRAMGRTLAGLPPGRQGTISALYLSECCVCVPKEPCRLQAGVAISTVHTEEAASPKHQAPWGAFKANSRGGVACETKCASNAFVAAISAAWPNRSLSAAELSRMPRSYRRETSSMSEVRKPERSGRTHHREKSELSRLRDVRLLSPTFSFTC